MILKPLIPRESSYLISTKGGFIVSRTGIQALKGQLFNAGDVVSPESSVQSYLNTPVIDDVTFKAGNYIDLDGNEIAYDRVELQTVLATVTQSKNIIATPIQGRNGTVKEYISDGDYSISLFGRISNKENTYPAEEVKNLVNICKIPQEIPILSALLNSIFDINTIVITGYNFPQEAGITNEQPFEINMLSDIPIQLQLDELI